MTIDELETFFQNVDLPDAIQLKPGEKITNVSAFVIGHLEIIRRNGNTPAFSSFYDRLIILKELLSNKTQ